MPKTNKPEKLAIPLSFEQTIAAALETPPEKKRKPCECGCGEYPKKSTSRFLPGHDLRKAYQSSK